MTEMYLSPLVSGSEIKSELRRRKTKNNFKTVYGSSRKNIADKVKLEEEDGWRQVRKNAKSTRMAKAKPADEGFEDEIWCILAQMGFKEMSSGRKFLISVEDTLQPRQIDVFAKDDETIVIVECTQKEIPGKKNMSSLIEKIRTIREPVFMSIRKQYGQTTKLKVRYAIATRNIVWSEADLRKCEEAQIAVITDGEIAYYSQLVQHLKQAARYQFLGHMFADQKIDGLANKVVATRGKMGGETFYTFLIRPDELLKIAYVGHKASRDIENLETYQRMLQSKRLKKIEHYINSGGKFPTNIVVNLKTNRRLGLKFQVQNKVGDEVLGILHLPPNYASAWIIDGQHRLYGYAYARESEGFKNDKTTIPVLAYENLPADKEMKLFVDINSEQVKVRPGLLIELYSNLHWRSSDPEKAFQALLSRISSRMNSDPLSPLKDRMVVTGKKKTSLRCLTQTSIRDGLQTAKLLGTFSKGAILPGPLSTAKTDAYEENLKKAVLVLSDCLRMFANQLENHWTTGDGPSGYLCTNNGIRALFHVIMDITEHIRQKDGTDLCLFEADSTVSEISPYLQVLIDYFQAAPAQQIQDLRRIGSSLTAVRQQSLGMEAYIKERRPDFISTGLEKYLDSRDEEGTVEASTKVNKIHRRLFTFVIARLKEHYGVQDKAWWTKGIPLKIRQACTNVWEAKNREGEEEAQLFLINYIDICLANWDIFKNEVSLDAADIQNKKANTKWIKDLNDIRQITTHPERGVLSTDQVAFVNETFEKVEKHLPDIDGQS